MSDSSDKAITLDHMAHGDPTVPDEVPIPTRLRLLMLHIVRTAAREGPCPMPDLTIAALPQGSSARSLGGDEPVALLAPYPNAFSS